MAQRSAPGTPGPTAPADGASAVRAPDAAGVAAAVKALRAGGLVGLPTETVYGLAADGLNAVAVAGIFAAKGRPHFDPLILHVATGFDLSRVARVNAVATRLMAAFWPGPLTLLLPRAEAVPDLVTSGLPTVAVRCPDHPVAQAVLAAFDGPLAAPSANRFGRISPTTPAAVVEELGASVAVVLDGGPCRVGVESTIVDCSGAEGEPVRLLRRGAVLGTQIMAALGLDGDLPLSAGVQVVAPGQLDAHYAPRTPLWRSPVPLEQVQPWPADTAALYFAPPMGQPAAPVWRVLAEDAEVHTAAVHLFAHLRALDASGCRRIVVAPVPLSGLGAAVDDRLLRASQGTVSVTPAGLAWQARTVRTH